MSGHEIQLKLDSLINTIHFIFESTSFWEIKYSKFLPSYHSLLPNNKVIFQQSLQFLVISSSKSL